MWSLGPLYFYSKHFQYIFVFKLIYKGLTKENDDIMIFVLYSCIITFILLSIFAIGALSFSGNLIEWIGQHWEEIRNYAEKD